MSHTAATDISITEFDYPLPDRLIARHPLKERDRCRLLVRRAGGELEERVFAELPELLPAGAMLVYNNTRVINARLRFRKGGRADGALIEVFCLEPREPADYARALGSTGRCRWLCFVGNSKKWKSGDLEAEIALPGGATATLKARRAGQEGNASVVEFEIEASEGAEAPTFAAVIESAGEIPIPPYLNRSTEASDSTDYQTVYSHISGSVAAPTAGLHFTPGLLDRLDRAGIERRELTLHVGAGTFQPVKSETIGGHDMHSELLAVSRELIEEIGRGGRPVIAVGTTSVRTLESLYHAGCMAAATGECPREIPQWYPYSPDHPGLSVAEAMEALAAVVGGDTFVASTRIIIAPGYRYRIVSGMVTNFHQPQSTLLLLVSAFTGGDWRRMYDYALAREFRFLSYGDACLLL